MFAQYHQDRARDDLPRLELEVIPWLREVLRKLLYVGFADRQLLRPLHRGRREIVAQAGRCQAEREITLARAGKIKLYDRQIVERISHRHAVSNFSASSRKRSTIRPQK